MTDVALRHGASGRLGPAGKSRRAAIFRSDLMGRGSVSSAYRKSDTCGQHRASLTGGVRDTEPAPVLRRRRGTPPLIIALTGWSSLRFPGFRAVRA